MKRNLLLGIAIISAVALSSCSVNKTASTAKNSDDVYFSQATAGEAPEYVAPKPVYQQQQDDVAYDGDNGDDDYYYYDDYSSRINRFGYFSPFSYYDSYYGNYNPYNYSNYGFSVGLNWSPFTMPYGSPYGYYGGIGYGYGAFSPYAGFGYGGYGYGGYGGYGYSPYSYWGTGYGYGGNYWGAISANSTYGTPRPNRGTGSPRGIGVGGRNGVGYNGVANNGIGYYPNRPTRGANGSYTTRPAAAGYSNNGGYSNTRPTRAARGGGNDSYQPQQRPASTARTPDRQPTYSPPAPSSSGNSGGGGGGGSSSGGGGGGRPARP